MAFHFSDQVAGSVLKALKEREGKSFDFVELPIRLNVGTRVESWVPIYTGSNLLANVELKRLAALVCKAEGAAGTGIEYVEGIAKALSKLKITDELVDALWNEIQASTRGR